MLKPITIHSRTGPDGSLTIRVATEVPETEVDVVLVIRPVRTGDGADGEAAGWPEGFLKAMYGSLADVGLKRHPQGEYETRNPIP